MSVKLTTSYWKIQALKKKIRIIQGSQGASKTYSILQIFFRLAIENSLLKFTVITENYPQLKDGPIADMQNIYRDAGLNFDNQYNKSEKNLHFSNGSVIQFRNLDNKDFHKAKGARRDYLFVNEANRVTWPSLEQMVTRTEKAIYFDFNPDHEFFIHEQFINAGRDDVDFLIVTYKDNELIPEGEKREIERRIEASKQPDASNQLKNWVRVYAYGELGTYSDRQIYNYEFTDEIPATARRIKTGMDFGSSPDPTIMVDCWVDGINLYWDEVFCANNLLPETIAGSERMSVAEKVESVGHEKGWPIVGDTDGRLSILDMRRRGFNVIAVKKPPGSQKWGVDKVRGFNLFITKRSTNIKKGIESWFWKVDDNGKIIPEPDGHEPDGLAAGRYAVMTSL